MNKDNILNLKYYTTLSLGYPRLDIYHNVMQNSGLINIDDEKFKCDETTENTLSVVLIPERNMYLRDDVLHHIHSTNPSNVIIVGLSEISEIDSSLIQLKNLEELYLYLMGIA